jgi:hypothetical protein
VCGATRSLFSSNKKCAFLSLLPHSPRTEEEEEEECPGKGKVVPVFN